MALAAGTRLGPYEILSPLGAGGMGEVYRARDTRLERTVAVKVLSPELLASAEARQRFKREAKTISQLSHPGICALFDVGREGDVEYLVMELLDGQTLSRRLADGPLPLDQSLRIGAQIADALGAAHRLGIVHRDLKPDNVMLTKTGSKLLDFGLAKAAGLGPPSDLTSSPTVAAASGNDTREGTILGTLLYMAPEQLEGREADARTDVFAFGAVMYEMMTGEKAFSGASQASVISAIMREEPGAVSVLAPMAPPALDRLVRGCLAKDPEERWQSAHDVGGQLRGIAEGGSQVATVAAVATPRRNGGRVARILAGAAAAIAASLGAALMVRHAEPPRMVTTTILPPEKVTLSGDEGSLMALSPDGTQIVFTAMVNDATKYLLWVRALDSLTCRPLPGTEGALFPFWSPDGRSIAFVADQKLKRVELASGSMRTLCDFSTQSSSYSWISKGGTWNRDGVIVLAPDPRGGLWRIPAEGGAPVRLTELDKGNGEFSHRFPTFLPDGRHFLYLAVGLPKKGVQEPNAIYVGSLDSKERRLIRRTDNVGAPAFTPYAGGYLLAFGRGELLAQRFDPGSLVLSDTPVAIHPRDDLYTASGAKIAYVEEPSLSLQLAWWDRASKRLTTIGKSAHFEFPRLARDGRRIATSIRDAATSLSELWVIDVDRNVSSRLTFGKGHVFAPTWSPDGAQIAYARIEGARSDIRVVDSSGAGRDETLYSDGDAFLIPADWSSDGRLVAVDVNDGKSIAIVSMKDRKATVLPSSPGNQAAGSFSPDGRFLSYFSDESGQAEVYVRSISGSEGRWQVSTSGGVPAAWSQDGKEILYVDLQGQVMSVGIRTDPKVELTSPRLVADAKQFREFFGLSPDGRRFLVDLSGNQERSMSITLVQNWAAGLKR